MIILIIIVRTLGAVSKFLEKRHGQRKNRDYLDHSTLRGDLLSFRIQS